MVESVVTTIMRKFSSAHQQESDMSDLIKIDQDWIYQKLNQKLVYKIQIVADLASEYHNILL